MNYAWARDFTLQLINQYSVSGQEVLPSYNNQADYIARIPALLDDAQVYVATTVRRIREVVPFSQLLPSYMPGWEIYDLPEDCWQISGGGLIRFAGPKIQRYHKYRMLGSKQIAIPEGLRGELELEYFRRPKLLGTSPADSDELDNTVEAQMALPYYVASHLVMYDNAFAYSALMNEFETKLERLYELPQTELTITEDVYDPVEWRYDG